METPTPKIPQLNQDTTSALIALARLLGHLEARELADAEQADTLIPLNQNEGTKDD